ncbi:MAG: hydroxymethylglutaryl-CoA lyase [Candidatus Cloacimonetes bacterium]|nr:hydroxymethylglutaryl-CoA lyase [Candidatus Cloacimonadota bacterium]
MDIKIVEVGPRDGLQNVSQFIPLDKKISFIKGLQKSGLTHLEVGAFVSPKWVPQMRDSLEICKQFNQYDNILALVPNQRGMDQYLEAQLKNVAFFTAASDTFNLKNTNKTFKDSLKVYEPLIQQAILDKSKIRMYISTAFYCPFDGKVSTKKVLEVVEDLLAFEIDEFSFGDTVGLATSNEVTDLINGLKKLMDISKINMHFHDTYGMALSNAAKSIELGVRSFDTSASGLGGCPYAPGASGNLATEDLVYFCENQGIQTGIDLDLLIEASQDIDNFLNRESSSKVKQAIINKG